MNTGLPESDGREPCPRCGALSPGGSTHCISCLTALSGTLEAHQ